VIFWSEGNSVNGSVYWCCRFCPENENREILVPVPIEGDTTYPFLLVSLPGNKPNLHAVPLNTNLSTNTIFCRYQNIDVFKDFCNVSDAKAFDRIYSIGSRKNDSDFYDADKVYKEYSDYYSNEIKKYFGGDEYKVFSRVLLYSLIDFDTSKVDGIFDH